MDSDTTSAHDAHYRLLEEFRTSSVPILLGTQMVAKGHDFPGVTLVGIISADLSLYIPDFRAGERTFQLITQVAGRAGRGDIPGVVILQTFNPDNYAVTAAMTHDYDTFAEKELAGRKEAGYPPFSRLILVELSSTDKQSLEKVSKAIAGYFSRYLPDETEILGPVEASVPRIRGRHRIHILLKSTGIIRLLPVVRHAVEKHQKSACAIAVDVDPIDLL